MGVVQCPLEDDGDCLYEGYDDSEDEDGNDDESPQPLTNTWEIRLMILL
jgi:hypothetical protein